MPRLIGDIGGTNARFALVDENGLSTEARTLQVADHPGLVEAALAYLDGRPVIEGPLSDRVVKQKAEGEVGRLAGFQCLRNHLWML